MIKLTIKKYFLFILISSAIISGCEDNIISECEDKNGFLDNTLKFSIIQDKIFNNSCAISGCHAGPNPQANLELTNGKSYENLYNVPSLLNPSFMRVKPGDSDNSFIIMMLKNTGPGTSQMPPSGKLQNSLIDSIASWIDQGALNN